MKERIKCFMSCGPNRMTRCGIGPRFTIITVICGLLTGWLTYRYPTVFIISGIPPWVFIVLGSVLNVVGVVIYLVALRTFNEGYLCKALVTGGMYSYVRHPIYAAWIMLICPGVVLFFRSWLMLMLPMVAYISFKVSVHHEDKYLENQFGQNYRNYRVRTSELFPIRFMRE